MPRPVHFEIHADDPDRAEAFYRDVFGWDIQRYEGSPVDYRLVTSGPDDEPGINGAIVQRQGPPPEDEQPVSAYVCTIAIASIEETERTVATAGGRQVMDRMEVPGVGLLSYFRDTEGNLFGALEPAAG
jgi:predicted enzyme related to lactoylglutathione lyase